MDQSQKQLLRAAARIHEWLLRRVRKPEWCLPAGDWREMTALAGQIEFARRRGWHRAAASRTEDLARAAESCQRRLVTLASDLRNLATSQPLATAADIYRDLLALEEEFEQAIVRFRRARGPGHDGADRAGGFLLGPIRDSAPMGADSSVLCLPRRGSGPAAVQPTRRGHSSPCQQ